MVEDEVTTSGSGAAARQAAAAGARPRASLPARRRIGKALLAAALALAAGSALAQPFFAGRMSSDERERFRRELRQQQEQGRRGGEPDWRRERLSPRERDQLRQQLRDARPDDRRGRGRRRD
ncbi:MAG: hypothetical protein KF755_02445 [Burkholderiaceae bacterium]|nr:hypothetical protein [Burkholderiaceae bacterium]